MWKRLRDAMANKAKGGCAAVRLLKIALLKVAVAAEPRVSNFEDFY